MSPPIKNYAQEFKKIIEGFRYNRGIREIFIDWLEIAACAVHQEPYHLGLVRHDEEFDKVEAQYLAAVKKYSKEELDEFAKLLAITKMALWEEKADFLGQIYMDLEISQDRSGEFFTPFEVSRMMAKMIIGDPAAHIKEKGFITVAEPACGAGGMLLAAAQALEEQGYNPRETMFFDATDISKACFDMAYIQTSLLGLSGIVRHGDTLRAKEFCNRFTPICRVFPARTNAFIESIFSTKAGENVADQPAKEQTRELNLEQETLASITTKTPVPEKQALTNLATQPDKENYVQGSLF